MTWVTGLISQRRRYATSASENEIAKPIAMATTVRKTCWKNGST